MDPSDSKRAQLAATFRKMPTAELQRRVAARQLVPLAQEAAELELKNRQSPAAPSEALPEGAFLFADGRRDAIAMAIATALMLGVAWWWLSPGLFFLVLLALGPLILATLGKLFPRIATALGLVAAVFPFALAAWAWHHGDLTPQGGDYRPLGALIAWIALFVVSSVSWAVAGGLLRGALHRGNWLDFNRKVQQMSNAAIDEITGRRPR